MRLMRYTAIDPEKLTAGIFLFKPEKGEREYLYLLTYYPTRLMLGYLLTPLFCDICAAFASSRPGRCPIGNFYYSTIYSGNVKPRKFILYQI